MYTQQEKDERFEQVCQRIEQGEPLRRILHSENAPMNWDMFYRLLEDKDKSERYARATSIRADMMFDEAIDIAFEKNADVVGVDKYGNPIVDGEAIQRSKLKVDTIKWAVSKMQPKKYGDKIDIDHTTKGESIVDKPNLSKLTTEQLQALASIKQSLNED